MDHIFARVKGLRKKPYFKLISNHTLFIPLLVTVDNCVPYNSDHNLDEEAWFKVEGFSHQPFCIDILKSDFDSKDYDDLSRSQFSKIAYIFSQQGDDFYFQKISPALFISRKIIAFGEAATIEESDSRLVVNPEPDAVYFKSSDTLVFKNLSTISGIFKGIDVLFKEATNEEVSQFLGENFISLTDGYDINSVSKPNRKRVALAMESLSTMTAQDRVDMLGYINDYCQGKLSFDSTSSCFNISKDDELKLLLYGVEQRFYTTPFGRKKRLANSVQDV